MGMTFPVTSNSSLLCIYIQGASFLVRNTEVKGLTTSTRNTPKSPGLLPVLQSPPHPWNVPELAEMAPLREPIGYGFARPGKATSPPGKAHTKLIPFFETRAPTCSASPDGASPPGCSPLRNWGRIPPAGTWSAPESRRSSQEAVERGGVAADGPGGFYTASQLVSY